VVNLQNFVRVEHALLVERNVCGPRGFRPAGNQESIGAEHRMPVVSFDHNLVRADKAGFAEVRVHAIAIELIVDDSHFMIEHIRDLPPQIGHLDVPLLSVAFAVNVALPKAGQVHDRFAHRLRRNRAGVHANAPHLTVAAVDDRDSLLQFGRCDGSLLSGRTAANHDQIVPHEPVSPD